MGVLSLNFLRSRTDRQRLPVYEPIASPASPSKERYSSTDDDEDDNTSDDDYESDYSDDSSPSTNGSRQTSGSYGSGALMLPKRRAFPASASPRRPARPYFYRLPNRIIRYLCVAMIMTIVLLIVSLIRASQMENRRIANGEVAKPPPPPAPWESFDFLTRYYGGVKSLVPFAESSPQYPRDEDEQPLNETADGRIIKPHLHPEDHKINDGPLPPSKPFPAYPGSIFAEGQAGIVECFVDKRQKVRIPPVRYFDGRPSGLPRNVMGSHELLSLPEDICFDRFGRFGPYGFGYSVRSGGLGVGEHGEKEGSEEVWKKVRQVDWRNEIDWADAQRRCYQTNIERFKPAASRPIAPHGFYIYEQPENTTTTVARRDETAAAAPAAPAEEAPKPVTTEEIEEKEEQQQQQQQQQHEQQQHKPAAQQDQATPPAATTKDEKPKPAKEAASKPKSKPKVKVPPGDLPRTAVVLRCWDEFNWGEEDIMNMRALITELSLASGGRYDVHLLMQVKNDAKHAIWADDEIYRQRIQEAVPAEFRGLVTLWSETQMLATYQGIFDLYTSGPDLPVHGVYRGLQMAMQVFAHQHPEYDYFWQWEMDIRYTGHYYDLLTKMERWAQAQPRKGLWERNARFYFPSVHGSWDDFRQMARVQTEVGMTGADNIWKGMHGLNEKPPTPATGETSASTTKGEKTVWGPLRPSDPSDWLDADSDPTPPTSYDRDRYVWGVGEEADYITLNPLFNPEGTTWTVADDITGYNETAAGGKKPPRRAHIITASRMSARLLRMMHRETALKKHHAFSEMWPATVALHHGYKAVFVPHPVYVDREWPTQYMAQMFNAGHNGATGGARTSVFGQREHNFRGVTWFYNSGFGPNLYRRWLGLRVNNDGGEQFEMQVDQSRDDASVGSMRGGEGRMCLPPMLLHPVKSVDLPVEAIPADEDEVAFTESDPAA